MNLGHRMEPSEVSELLSRAQEIQNLHKHVATSDQDLQAFLAAAEEAGIEREAMMQALEERVGFRIEDLVEGDLVFAKSSDGRHYTARILRLDATRVQVRFLSGSEAFLPVSDLRQGGLLPGAKVQVDLPTYGGWTTATVAQLNLEGRTATVNLWGVVQETVPLEKLRLFAEDPKGRYSFSMAELVAVVTTSLVSGGVVGVLIHWIVTR
jgi:hypothetical protein